MKRTWFVLIASLCMTVVAAVPAGAGVDDNPNAEMFVDVVCEGGLEFGAIWSPTPQSVSGHDVDANIVGVAKSVWLTDAEGTPLEPFFDTPGKGLDNQTVWCFWPVPDVPGLYIGGDILFAGKVRP